MRRSFLWGVFAAYPLLTLPLVAALEESAPVPLDSYPGPVAALLVKYWWVLLFATFALHLGFFVVHALRDQSVRHGRRVIWSTAMLLVGPIVIPAYWWLHSETEQLK